ncbi:TadE/TadG family type IV pilus assembly protein [Paenibacillus sp. GYB003]|uniref:TadE/TadG family type IV pilus assembly protein n=1 Tax=Paenibacillus sp. GYB003 TaxID=2994392 RepID=UPI002F96798D
MIIDETAGSNEARPFRGCRRRNGPDSRRFARGEHGGVALEATVAFPFFLAFVLALVCLIKLTVADMALQNAVAETAKQMAASAYPVELLANEAMQAYSQSKVGTTADEWLGKIRAARDKLTQGEQWVEDYKAFIPDFLVRLVEWEQMKREQAERMAGDEADRFAEEHIAPLVKAAFKEAVMHYADTGVLKEDRLSVHEVELPRLADSGKRFVGITAQYTVKLPIPFVNKSVTIRKKAYERIWTGA